MKSQVKKKDIKFLNTMPQHHKMMAWVPNNMSNIIKRVKHHKKISKEQKTIVESCQKRSQSEQKLYLKTAENYQKRGNDVKII